MSRLLHHPLTALAAKSAVAAGAAYWAGSSIPSPIGDYSYYAPLAAFTVIYPSIADSFLESARAVAAILLGIAVAVALQLALWTSPFTVGLAIGLGVAAGAIGWFRDQRSWVPLAALFVLSVGGANPENYIIGYVSQVLLGAAIGLATNYALVPPLPDYELDASVTSLRRALVDQLRDLVDDLTSNEEPREDHWQKVRALAPARERMMTAASQTRRARLGNPRAGRKSELHDALTDLGGALFRCSAAVEAIGVFLLDRKGSTPLDDELRAATATTFSRLADVLDAPDEASEHAPAVVRAHASVDTLLDRSDDAGGTDREGRYLAGAVAIAARRCLDTFVLRYERSGATARRRWNTPS